MKIIYYWLKERGVKEETLDTADTFKETALLKANCFYNNTELDIMVLAIVLKFALIEIMVIIIMKYNNIQKVVKEFKTVIYINI